MEVGYIIIIIIGIIVIIAFGVFAVVKVFQNKVDAILSSMSYKHKMNNYMDSLFGYHNLHNVHACSRQLVSNFKSPKTIDYLVKYFGLILNDETIPTLTKMEILMSNCEKLICKNKNSIMSKYFRKEYVPFFKMSYVSPAGRSSASYSLQLTDINILWLIQEIAKKQRRVPKIVLERKKLTQEMREAVLARDNFTCCICGNSQYNEPNLLLEVDHIIPISKGGKTEPNNLQTLCWKCNRAKSDNL